MRMIREEGGFTLIELLVSMISTLVVLSAVLMLTSVALRNQDRINDRVVANQTARPVMATIVNELHSACVAQHVAPIIVPAGGGVTTVEGASDTQITFLSKAGNTVSPTPDKHVIKLTGTTLTDTAYQAVGGSQPGPWTFLTTPLPTYPRTLATNVSAFALRYYQFVNGAISPTTLTTPLSATDAAHVSQVSVSMTIGKPTQTSSLDMKSPITLNDTIDLRLENAGQYPNQENLPCV